MISPRILFQKQPFASHMMQGVSMMDVLVQDEFKNTLSYALAEMAFQNPLTADQLEGAKMLVREILSLAFKPEEEPEFRPETLTQPMSPEELRATMRVPKRPGT